MLTSANAVRHAGPALGLYRALPVYAVGEATAAAARSAGFEDVRVRPSDAAALLALIAGEGVSHVLHLAGREHREVGHPAVRVTRRIVYAADPVAALPEAAIGAARGRAVALLHSPRAAALFASLADRAGLVRGEVAIAAISPAALAAAGPGWRGSVAAATPDDAALLAAAAGLCD